MQLWERQSVFAQNVALLIQQSVKLGYHCTLGEAFRTAEQAKIYAQEGKGIVHSLHCERLALDINLLTSDGQYLDGTESYRTLGCFWESLNKDNRWGGRFLRVDGNHFEMKDIL